MIWSHFTLSLHKWALNMSMQNWIWWGNKFSCTEDFGAIHASKHCKANSCTSGVFSYFLWWRSVNSSFEIQSKSWKLSSYSMNIYVNINCIITGIILSILLLMMASIAWRMSITTFFSWCLRACRHHWTERVKVLPSIETLCWLTKFQISCEHFWTRIWSSVGIKEQHWLTKSTAF